MPTTRRGARLIGMAVAIAAVSLTLGCAPRKYDPTPIVVYVTPSPTASPSATPSPSPTIAAVETPTEVPSPTASPAPTAPLVPAMPASLCTGTADNKSFWAEVASKMSWDVYCPVFPSGWFVKTGSYDTGAGGKVTMTYKGPSGAIVTLNEGNFCFGAADICGPSATTVGPVFLADLPATLVTLPGNGNAIYVAPGTAHAYLLSGTGISQATLLSFAAALSKVSKS
jgi:hypothetical protein